MPDRKNLVCTPWLAALLAMLAWASVAPGRASGSGSGVAVSGPDGSPRPIVLPSGPPAVGLHPSKAAEPVEPVLALPSEDEEQDRADALGGPRASSLARCWYCKLPWRPSIVPRSTLSLYPLRC